MEDVSEKDPSLWVGRSWMDAPEVDGNVYIKSSTPLQAGCFYSAKITATKEYDLVGEL